jgi:hypothetical protein
MLSVYLFWSYSSGDVLSMRAAVTLVIAKIGIQQSWYAGNIWSA